MTYQPLVYGLHAVSALLEKHPNNIKEIIIQIGRQDKRIKSILLLADQYNISIKHNDRKALDDLTKTANHQGIAAVVSQEKSFNETDLTDLLSRQKEPLFLLILDGIQDPHNLGASLRSADAAGVHAVIAPKDRSVGLNATVRKVACGAADSVPFIQVTNLARTIRQLQERGIWFVGGAAEAKDSLYNAKLTGHLAIVLGSEGSGLRRLTKEHCDFLVNIPMAGSVSSLNVSVAAGIFLFEAVRQRRCD